MAERISKDPTGDAALRRREIAAEAAHRARVANLRDRDGLPTFTDVTPDPAAASHGFTVGNAPRDRDGPVLHDGAIHDPRRCPRGLTDCAPLARYASPAFASYMCCGQTSSAPVPSDRLRLCIKSTHAHGVDVLVNLDERDAVHTAAVLLSGIGSLGSVCITATDQLSHGEDGTNG